MRVATIWALLAEEGLWGAAVPGGAAVPEAVPERRGRARPGSAARPAPLAPRNFTPAPADDRDPHRRHHPPSTNTPLQHRHRARPRPLPLPPLLHLQEHSGRPFWPASHGGHRSRPTAAAVHCPFAGKRGTTHPTQGHGADGRDSEPRRPTRQRDPRPAAREVGSGAGAPHAGQPHPSLPRRTRAAPAARRAAAANTYPESFPIFTKLNTSIHAAG